ncbi:MAG TPA: hypothetical protein VLS95_07955, partial [Arthrobacter sp.]|nr:hypothetical protein [Arthrobacter sp.]
NALAPGELLRSIHLPASALASRVAFRRLSLSNLGRSGVLLIGRLDADGGLVLTITAATKRPVQLRLGNPANPANTASGGSAAGTGGPAGTRTSAAAELSAALDAAIPDGLYHADIHGLPAWRKDMTYRLAEEIRAELAAPAGTASAHVSGDFWPPPRTPQVQAPQHTSPRTQAPQHTSPRTQAPQAPPQQEGA